MGNTGSVTVNGKKVFTNMTGSGGSGAKPATRSTTTPEVPERYRKAHEAALAAKAAEAQRNKAGEGSGIAQFPTDTKVEEDAPVPVQHRIEAEEQAEPIKKKEKTSADVVGDILEADQSKKAQLKMLLEQ